MNENEEKLNCWEFSNCGEQGHNCPARLLERYDSINNGCNAGRVCWAVVGTLCCNKNQNDLSIKYDGCIKCEFFNYVHIGEDKNFTIFEEVFKRNQI